MNRKQVELILAFFSLTTSLYAQTSIGVEGGLSYNSYHTNVSNRAATSLVAKTGIAFSVPFRYKVCSWLYVVAAPGVVEKGYSMNRTDSLNGIYDQHNNVYVQLPIGIGVVKDFGRVRVELDGGVYGGYWLYGRVKGATADIFGSAGSNNSQQYTLSSYSESYSFDPRRDNRWQIGWWLGAEVSCRLVDAWRLLAGARYYQQLTRQEKAAVSPIPAYNRTWIFSIGGAWSLPQSKPRRL